ncbi:hypothetical protein B0T10DRAFT_251345 [Thelonectria olida]|uniref:Secreted protein n=1 Tax=Thelonectria olida TaxID=1576542 RepID=A0A9P9AQ39_9HYPO|nr:hypothetical protein B0T10DRAFT_251345 [Thelonectria olida]
MRLRMMHHHGRSNYSCGSLLIFCLSLPSVQTHTILVRQGSLLDASCLLASRIDASPPPPPPHRRRETVNCLRRCTQSLTWGRRHADFLKSHTYSYLTGSFVLSFVPSRGALCNAWRPSFNLVPCHIQSIFSAPQRYSK